MLEFPVFVVRQCAVRSVLSVAELGVQNKVLIQDFAYLRVPTCCDRDLACTAAEKIH